MIIYPAVIVHGLADAKAALAPGLPVTLLSAPGAALYAGCLWWREVVAAARAGSPQDQAVTDVLDCADAAAAAMGALRSGMCRLVLWPDTPGWAAVAAIAAREGGFVLTRPPAALDLGQRNALRRLPAWLRASDR